MHEIDTNGHVSNQFNEGDPLVPRLPTQVDKHWLNAIQNELVNVIEAVGIALVKGTNTQLLSALRNFVMGDASGPVKIVRNTADERALKLTGAGTNAAKAVLEVANSSTGPCSDMTSGSEVPTEAIRNTGTGPCLQMTVEDAHYHARFVPVATLPSTGPSGAALGASDRGAVVYVNGGGLNKLYVWDGSAWNPCW